MNVRLFYEALQPFDTIAVEVVHTFAEDADVFGCLVIELSLHVLDVYSELFLGIGCNHYNVIVHAFGLEGNMHV